MITFDDDAEHLFRRLYRERGDILENMREAVEKGAHDAIRYWLDELETKNAELGRALATAMDYMEAERESD